MKVTEYEEMLNLINEKYEQEKKSLARQYALSNNHVSIDDIVIDQIGPLLVRKIDVSFGFMSNIPECVYHGVRLTKKMTPRVHNSKGSAYQKNVKKHIVNVDD